MSLKWDFREKVGEVTIERQYDLGPSLKFDLYQGNALLIAIYNYEENEQKWYTLQWFWCDKEHMDNCLGISKTNKDNIHQDLREIVLYKDKMKKGTLKTIINGLIKAFDDIRITITEAPPFEV